MGRSLGRGVLLLVARGLRKILVIFCMEVFHSDAFLDSASPSKICDFSLEKWCISSGEFPGLDVPGSSFT